MQYYTLCPQNVFHFIFYIDCVRCSFVFRPSCCSLSHFHWLSHWKVLHTHCKQESVHSRTAKKRKESCKSVDIASLYMRAQNNFIAELSFGVSIFIFVVVFIQFFFFFFCLHFLVFPFPFISICVLLCAVCAVNFFLLLLFSLMFFYCLNLSTLISRCLCHHARILFFFSFLRLDRYIWMYVCKHTIAIQSRADRYKHQLNSWHIL